MNTPALALLLLACLPCAAVGTASAASGSSPHDRCVAIARDIAALKPVFPALKDFDPAAAVAPGAGELVYEYRCRVSTEAVGWHAGVPQPQPDGVWFLLRLWDPADPAAADSPLNTQPLQPVRHLAGSRVTFLYRAGQDVAGLEDALLGVLRKHGLREEPDAAVAPPPLFARSPADAVAIATRLLRARDYATLLRYYDLEGSGVAREGLDAESFFTRKEPPEGAHPAGFWRYRQPFPPGFSYLDHEAGDAPGVHRIRVRIEIDQGDGRTQVGLQEFLMRESADGWQFLPGA